MVYEVDVWDRSNEERYFFNAHSLEEVEGLLLLYDGKVDNDFLKELENARLGELVCTRYDCAVTKLNCICE